MVRPWGPSPAGVLFLVEAPSMADERMMELGRTPEFRLLGELVADSARFLGVDRPSYRIVSMVLCRPTEGRFNPSRLPERGEILACAPNVIAEIDKTRAQQIFFVGKLVSYYYAKEFPEGITIQAPEFLDKGGAKASPWYQYKIRTIAEGLRNLHLNEKVM